MSTDKKKFEVIETPWGTLTIDSNPFNFADEQRAEQARKRAENVAEHEAYEQRMREEIREISLTTLIERVTYQQSLREATPNADGIHVGDLFYETWGYDQTNIDFYQVVGLKGKRTAVISRIGCEYIEGYKMTGEKRPCRGAFVGEEYTVRTRICDDYNPPQKQLGSPKRKGCRLYPTTDDKRHYYTSYC